MDRQVSRRTFSVGTRHAWCVRELAAISALVLLTAWSNAADWPHWRGPQRNDVVGEASGYTSGGWLAKKAAWTTAVGRGCSSPLVVKGRLYTMGWNDGKDHVSCLDANTGKVLWKRSYPCSDHGRNHNGDEHLYAGPSSTPEYDPETGYLYTLSIDGDLNCWDTRHKGERKWGFNLIGRYRVQKRAIRDYGCTMAPLVYGDWVIVEVGAREGTLMAFAKRTGQRKWVSECKDEAGHTGGLAPMMVEGVPCVCVLTLNHLLVARLDRGKEGKTVAAYEWHTEYQNNICTPAIHDNCVLLTSVWNHSTICKLRITLRGAAKVWEKRSASQVCSPVIYKNHIYWVYKRVYCLDLSTGQRKWVSGPVGDVAGSCVATDDGRLIVWCGRGKLVLAETAEHSSQQYKQLAKKDNVLPGTPWPHVVFANGRVYCKDADGKLKCFPVRGSSSSASR